MAGIKDLANVWTNVRQIDLRPLREEAEQGVKIAIIGREGSGRETLAAQMRRDPAHPLVQSQTPMLLADLETAQKMGQKIAEADLIILLIGSGSAAAMGADSAERSLLRTWDNSAAQVLVFLDCPAEGSQASLNLWMNWDHSRVVCGPVDDTGFLVREFVPLVLELLPAHHLALGRYFPLFRLSIAERLINESCFSNAAYSLSTGLAEIVPALGIPLNVADMVVLSKNQAFLVYKLGLALGLSTQWQDYVSEFGSVLGGGFLWRQLARSLVGLIPAYGIIPKVAVAYAGTYVVGHVVLQWYLTGRHVSGKQMRMLYGQALARGRNVARNLLSRARPPRLGRRKPEALPAPQNVQVCPDCGRTNPAGAQYCQYCGRTFAEAADGQTPA